MLFMMSSLSADNAGMNGKPRREDLQEEGGAICAQRKKLPQKQTARTVLMWGEDGNGTRLIKLSSG
jgi:hypothetical protein